MKVSILIRAYNAAATISRAVDSALAQTYPDIEIIVVDDGSRDATAEILASYNDPRLRVIHQENAGATAAGTNALVASTGTYVTFLDADDEFMPNLVSELVAAALQSAAEFVYCNYFEEYEGTTREVRPESPFQTIAIGVLYRRDAFEREGWYQPGVFFAEYDLILRTLGRWNYVHVPQALFTYHRDTGSLTGSSARVATGLEQLATLHPTRLNEIHSIRSYMLPAV